MIICASFGVKVPQQTQGSFCEKYQDAFNIDFFIVFLYRYGGYLFLLFAFIKYFTILHFKCYVLSWFYPPIPFPLRV